MNQSGLLHLANEGLDNFLSLALRNTVIDVFDFSDNVGSQLNKVATFSIADDLLDFLDCSFDCFKTAL